MAFLAGVPYAHADTPTSESHARVAIIGGYGWSSPAFDSPLKLGLGVRGGTLLGSTRLYLGGVAVYHLGSHSVGSNAYVGHYDEISQLGYLVADFGYDLAVGPLSLLPYVGAGGAWLRARSCWDSRGCSDLAETPVSFALTAGLALYVVVGRFCAGADARLLGTGTALRTSEDTVDGVSGVMAYGFAGVAF